MRYLSEFFQGIYTPDLQTIIDNAVTIQKLLGKVQDTRRDVEFFQTHSQLIKENIKKGDPPDIFLKLIIQFINIQTENLEQFFDFWADFASDESINHNKQIIQTSLK